MREEVKLRAISIFYPLFFILIIGLIVFANIYY